MRSDLSNRYKWYEMILRCRPIFVGLGDQMVFHVLFNYSALRFIVAANAHFSWWPVIKIGCELIIYVMEVKYGKNLLQEPSVGL